MVQITDDKNSLLIFNNNMITQKTSGIYKKKNEENEVINELVKILDEHRKIDLQTNDLLMIRSNGSVSLVGRTAIVSQANNNDTFAGYLIRLRFINPSIYRAKFLHYYLQSHNARIYIENVAKSTSGVNNINSDEISKIPIPWGDDDRIKHVVCNIDRYLSISNNICNTVDEALHQAEAMRQSILKQAFEGEYKFARV